VFKHITILSLLVSLANQCSAQSFEFGGMVGGSNYHGDLAYNIVLKETRFSGGAFARINFNEYWTMRPTISYLQIGGADSNFAENKLRNLSFRNNMWEVSNVIELNFKPFSNKATANNTTFYAMAGIAALLHKPEAKLNDKWVELRPVRTENINYKSLLLTVPMGAGVKHAVNPNFIVGLEVGWRKTFTDHLDDVSTTYQNLSAGDATYRQLSDRSWEVSENGQPLASQGDMRGDPNLKDWYFQTALTLSYRFTPIQCPF
jgi:hypothetical protein